MSRGLTSDSQVALTDTVTGVAFGPLFDSAEHAEDFCRWLADPEACGLPGHPAGTDPRTLGNQSLLDAHSRWHRERLDDEGDLCAAVELEPCERCGTLHDEDFCPRCEEGPS